MRKQKNVLLKALSAFLIVISFFAAALQTHAQMTTNPNPRIVQGMTPEVRNGETIRNIQTGQMSGMTVHSQNVSPVGFATTVCAQEMVNGVNYHLGCIPSVPYRNANDGTSTFDFNVWPTANVGGTRTMMFTYRDFNGNWQQMMSPTGTQVTATMTP